VIERAHFIFFVSILSLLSSCITVNVPIGAGPDARATVWTVEPDPPGPSAACNGLVVKVKDFSSSASVEGMGITVILEDGTLNRSGDNIWFARPAEFLPDILVKAMVETGAWGAVLRRSTVLDDDLVVEGYVRELGGRATEDGWEAVLDVDVTLLEGEGNALLFQENYRFTWTLDSPGYAELASAMDILVGIWCEEVMNDMASSVAPIR